MFKVKFIGFLGFTFAARKVMIVPGFDKISTGLIAKARHSLGEVQTGIV